MTNPKRPFPAAYFALASLALAITACSVDIELTSPTATTPATLAPNETVIATGQKSHATPVLDTQGTMDALTSDLTLTFRTPTPPFERNTDQEYSEEDRPDDLDGYQVHFVYAIPRDGTDRLRDLNGEIVLSASAANYWLASKTDGQSLRYDTFDGELDISFLALPLPAEDVQPFDFYLYLYNAGFRDQSKSYVVYYDGLIELTGNAAICGVARGNAGTIFMQAYFAGFDAITCPRPTRTENYADHLELTLVHEVLHILGAVSECAPHFDGGSHVTDSSYDLMSPYFSTQISPELTVLDWKNDDYYATGSQDCPDLANSVFMQPTVPDAELPPDWE